MFDLFQKSAGLIQKEKQKAVLRGKGHKDGLASAEVDTALKRVSVSRYIAVQVGRWACKTGPPLWTPEAHWSHRTYTIHFPYVGG